MNPIAEIHKPKIIINMKQHLLKNSFLRGVLFLLLCVVDLGNAWGEEVTFDATKQGYSNQQVINSATITNGITISFTKGTASPAYYTSGTAIRCYAKGGFTITSTIGDITKIVFTYGSSDGSNAISTNVGEFDKNTWTGSEPSVEFTIGGTSGNRRIKTITVTYQSSTTPDVPTPELESINFEAANNIEYYVGEEVTEQGLTVTAYYNDESSANVTENVEAWTFTPGTINSTDVNSIDVKFDYEGKIYGPYNFTITVRSIANTAESAYTVAQAYELIDNNRGLTEEVYVKGIISQIDSYNSTYGSITYWISDDGTTTSQQFQCYGGLNIGGTQFTSINDLKLGTVVVLKGLLKKYNATYEFDKNNVIISNDETNARTLSSIEISGTPTKTSYYIGDTPSAEGLTVNAVYSDDSEVEVTEDVTWTFNPETITEETTQITATASYRGEEAEKTFDVTVAAAPIEYTYTLDLTTKTFSSATNSSVKWNTVVANITLSKGSSSTTANNYIGGSTYNNNQCTHTRIYKDQILTISPKAKLIKVVFTATSNDYANNVLYYENAIATVDGVYINVFPEDGNCDIKITPGEATRFTQMVIHYQPTTVEISSAGLATFCLPYNATIPDGLTAYTATDNGETVKLTAIGSGKIAAGEGVVLEGEEGTYTFVATAEDVSATEGNQMVGVTEDTPLTSADNAYMLTRKKDDGSIAFRLLATDYTLGANKAYLKLENNARNLISVVWDDNATGIYDLSEKEEAENGAIYNLAGQKLMRAQKGINIINGKLVIK